MGTTDQIYHWYRRLVGRPSTKVGLNGSCSVHGLVGNGMRTAAAGSGVWDSRDWTFLLDCTEPSCWLCCVWE